MDLDDRTLDEDGSMDALAALRCIDAKWYKELAGKKARWMDLIGDYAGSECFVLDGESLLQHVLDDELLALGREGEPSFQLAHAVHSMELLLHEMCKRSAAFDVVFWEDARHLTLKGRSDSVVAARLLARALLFRHLCAHAAGMGLVVHAFAGLADPAWQAYQRRTKPMFVMLNDGGALEGDDRDMAARILLQRDFVFGLLTSGVAVTLLHGAEFRDSKIFSFVLEQRFGMDTRTSLPDSLWEGVRFCRAALDGRLKGRFPHVALEPLRTALPDPISLDEFLKEVMKYFVSHQEGLPHLFWELAYPFFLHLMVLPSLTIDERARDLGGLDGQLAAVLNDSFLPYMNIVMAAFVSRFGVSLDVDGRVFVGVLRYFTTVAPSLERRDSVRPLVGDEVSSRLEALWSSANVPLPDLTNLRSTQKSVPGAGDPGRAAPEASNNTPFTLLPFHNEVFDAELEAVHVAVADINPALPPAHLEFSQGTPFADTTHWHAHRRPILPKHLGGGTPKQLDERVRRKRLKQEQRFMAQMQRLAATLTGASGRMLQQIVIPATGRKVAEVADKEASTGQPGRDKKEKEAKKAAPTQQKKGKAAPLSGKERIRQEHARDKRAKEDTTSQGWWLEQLRQIDKLPTLGNKATALQALLRNPRTDAGWLAVEARLFALHLTLQQWLAEPDPDAPALRDRYAVALLRDARALYAREDGLTPTALGVLAGVMLALGFAEYVAPLEAAAAAHLQPDRELAFSFVKLVRSKSRRPAHKFMAVREDPVVWQMRVFGEYMDRSMDGAPDARVAFVPDAWQRDVLDILDRPKSSVLVVAPTSAGKTFISFYAMEKVLRESDDGILVYVAPTKALVNQVAAEVYARFRKDVDGRTCWAIHTRDYHVHDPQKCQILVTVPEMLAIMLLSPPLAKTWTPRIRRIILDEIHTIGQHEGGTVWEQIILLTPCPIIGLSATIGEPEKFNAWLGSVQNAKGFEHKFIHHPHRYSHLRKFAYFPQLLPKDQPFAGLDSSRAPTEVMRFIHPAATLSFGGTLPPDLSLEAPDLLRLYEALKSQGYPDVEKLDPTTFFPRDEFIRQKDVLQYESKIKNALSSLLAAPDALVSTSALQQVIRYVHDPVLAQTPVARLNAPPSDFKFASGLIHLLSDLNSTGSLPALLFNFDRSECTDMARRILATLEGAEETWRAKSPEWKRKISQWEEWRERQKDRERLAQKAAARKKDQDDDGPQQGEDRSWESSFDPQDPSPQFSFANMAAYSKEELMADIAALRWTSTEDFLFQALWRGVAVHHSGLNKAYRSLVERLFRVGFLRVVIATSTLALGINAPTKTSVFCGDSPFLTALTFRQCAGRAGRRGFDLLGRVVFYGIPLDRINRILLSRLPRLTGTFPLSSTMVLRLFSLLEGSDYAPYAVDAIHSILRLPHISFGSDFGKDQLLHHLRFSIDYLRRSHLLSEDGKPVNLFGLASHLYYTEPSNLALTALLQNGVIHDVCGQSSLKQAERDLVQLFCHLFGRRYLPEVYATTENIRELIKKGPSRVVLPPLDPRAQDVLQEHQVAILDVFSAYALAFSSQHTDELGTDNQLPLSKLIVGAADTSAREATPLITHLAQTARTSPHARSRFVATSGHADAFGGVDELARTARRGVHLNAHAIPSAEGILQPARPLNAYLYDFFMHGQVDALVHMNGIRRGDVWYALEGFWLVLTSIRGDIEHLLTGMAREAQEAQEEADGVDSGYQSFDPSEMDEEDSAGGADAGAFKRPRGASDRDWRVYEVVNSVTNEFGAKFKAMWA
ncbi:P-loop containing nucleoside triphosphate hydrolase protein [Gloeopeniophorella convolvens]|nr:P-loop containing nucleoside triphosphate hydrolase protein [Gloeopeniophorella convolvens]